jgi:tRNA(Phe) wybutosine-synthesizing methylase Tyw3
MNITVHREPPKVQPISKVIVELSSDEIYELLIRYPKDVYVASNTVRVLVKLLREQKIG